MSKTTTIVLASCASVASTAIISTLTYFKGRSDGFRMAQSQAQAALPSNAASATPTHVHQPARA